MAATRIQDSLLDVYDYVIVGAGSSGCVLASRLSEDPSKTVLILEAGEDDTKFPDIAVPGRASNLQERVYDWGFEMTPHPHVFKGYKNQVYHSVCGKVIGGSGSLNYLVYMRGTPHDYDIWENLGCKNWGYRQVLPYFKKSENCQVNKLLDSGFHGKDGPMTVTEARISELGKLFIEAGKSLGHQETDCNSDNPIGFMAVQNNIGDGIRQSSATCFLRPASNRSNLHIATKTHVTKILISHNIARGVQCYRDRHLRTVRARREVILCAGAYCSPQILMLSGIGPKDHLDSMGIPVLKDLPVGNNLQEHTAVLGLEFQIDKPLSLRGEDFGCDATLKMYETMRAGPLSTGAIETTALLRSKCQDPGNPNPDVQLMMVSSLLGTGRFGRAKNMERIKDEVFHEIFEGNEDKNGFTIIVLTTHGKARGNVRLKDKDPLVLPEIDHQTLTNPEDVEILVEGVQTALKLSKTKPLREIGARLTGRVLPGYSGEPFTDAYWHEYVRTLTNTYHPVGTCRMGRLSDPRTVVDSQLRVKGIERLRVVDASIMPEITSANPNATCIMIGEKAADLIRQRSLSSKL